MLTSRGGLGAKSYKTGALPTTKKAKRNQHRWSHGTESRGG